MKLSLSGLLPLFGFLGLTVFFAIALTRDPSRLPSELIDRPVPDFALSSLYEANELITQDSFIGQVSLLNVFGSWCVACVQEHPKLIELSDNAPIKLIGIDWRDTREDGARWLAQYGDPYDKVIFDSESILAIDLGVTGAPESYIIDKAGRIRFKHVGIITDDIWENELRPLVQSLHIDLGPETLRAQP